MGKYVSHDLAEFGIRINVRAEEALRSSQLFLMEIVTGVGRALVQNTPVRTGQARGNYLAAINSPRHDMILGGTSSEQEAFNRSIRPILGLIKPDDTIFIRNNLWYIGDLNRGKSPQAPPGFLQKSVASGLAKGLAAYKRVGGFK